MKQLCDLGIEADIIFFTAYDWGRWGYDTLTPDEHERVIRYVCARLSAYRNVWWSMANEYDLMKGLTVADWDRFFKVTQECDPYQHLRSIHNAGTFYEHAKPWVTHCSIQNHETQKAWKWREQYRKPVIVDECSYEGNVAPVWGNITAREMVHRFWMGVCNGGYVGHGETYLNKEEILWWSRGGKLSGQSPERIRFLHKILQEAPGGLGPVDMGWDKYACAGRAPDYYLYYTGNSQSLAREFTLPEGNAYAVDVLDTWEMTITRLDGTFAGKCEIPLPGKPWLALRLQRIV